MELKELKIFAKEAGIAFKKNASKKKMEQLLEGVKIKPNKVVEDGDLKLLEGSDSYEERHGEGEGDGISLKEHTDAAVEGKEKFFIGKCVKTGKDLYKWI